MGVIAHFSKMVHPRMLKIKHGSESSIRRSFSSGAERCVGFPEAYSKIICVGQLSKSHIRLTSCYYESTNTTEVHTFLKGVCTEPLRKCCVLPAEAGWRRQDGLQSDKEH